MDRRRHHVLIETKEWKVIFRYLYCRSCISITFFHIYFNLHYYYQLSKSNVMFKAALKMLFLYRLVKWLHVIWEGSFMVLTPHRLITRMCSSPHLCRAFKQLSADCFGFTATLLLRCSHQRLFQMQQRLFFSEKARKTAVDYLLNTKWQSQQPEHSGAFSSKTELKQSEYWTYIHTLARNTTPMGR